MLCSSCGFMDAGLGKPCPRCGHQQSGSGITTTTQARTSSGPVAQAAVGRLHRRSTTDAFLAKEGLSGAGMTALGLVLVVAAALLHAHFAQVNAMCSTGLGQLGQAFSSTATHECDLASTAESAVGPFTFFGVASLVLGGVTLIHALTRPRRV